MNEINFDFYINKETHFEYNISKTRSGRIFTFHLKFINNIGERCETRFNIHHSYGSYYIYSGEYALRFTHSTTIDQENPKVLTTSIVIVRSNPLHDKFKEDLLAAFPFKG